MHCITIKPSTRKSGSLDCKTLKSQRPKKPNVILKLGFRVYGLGFRGVGLGALGFREDGLHSGRHAILVVVIGLAPGSRQPPITFLELKLLLLC